LPLIFGTVQKLTNLQAGAGGLFSNTINIGKVMKDGWLFFFAECDNRGIVL
jgi:hypothetical protein